MCVCVCVCVSAFVCIYDVVSCTHYHPRTVTRIPSH